MPLVLIARGIGQFWRFVNLKMRRVMPPRVANLVSTLSVLLLLVILINKLVLKQALTQPTEPFTTRPTGQRRGRAT